MSFACRRTGEWWHGWTACSPFEPCLIHPAVCPLYLSCAGLGCGWHHDGGIMTLAVYLAYGRPMWHCWREPESWYFLHFGFSIAVYTSVLLTWCWGEIGPASQEGPADLQSWFLTQEEFLPSHLSIHKTKFLRNLQKSQSWEPHVAGETLILPVEIKANVGLCSGPKGQETASIS